MYLLKMDLYSIPYPYGQTLFHTLSLKKVKTDDNAGYFALFQDTHNALAQNLPYFTHNPTKAGCSLTRVLTTGVYIHFMTGSSLISGSTCRNPILIEI